MNISAAKSGLINEQTSFGKEYQIEDAEYILRLAKELNDSFQKAEEPEHKSKAGVIASVVVATLAMYVIGKSAASKVMTAFPSISTKLSNGMRKGANFVRDFSDDVAKGVKLEKGGKFTKFIGEKVSKFENLLRINFIKLRDKSSIENLIGNTAGLTAVAAVTPEIISVDGNNDGISDIAQKNVNAYKNAMNRVGILSEIIEALT